MAEARDWEVLLIGGGGAVGKTHVAQRLARRLRVDCLQVDDIRLVLQRAVPLGEQPALHFFLTADITRVEFADALAMQEEIARYVSHKLEAVIAHHLATRSPLILEGDAIAPELAAACVHEHGTQGRVRAVFLEEPDPSDVYRSLVQRGRGTSDEVALRHWAAFHHAQGAELARRARRLGLPVVGARPRNNLLGRVARAAGLQLAGD